MFNLFSFRYPYLCTKCWRVSLKVAGYSCRNRSSWLHVDCWVSRGQAAAASVSVRPGNMLFCHGGVNNYRNTNIMGKFFIAVFPPSSCNIRNCLLSSVNKDLFLTSRWITLSIWEWKHSYSNLYNGFISKCNTCYNNI